MQKIIILETVNIPNSPQFKEGQCVRVSDSIADMLVERGHAKYDKNGHIKAAKDQEKKDQDFKDKDKKAE